MATATAKRPPASLDQLKGRPIGRVLVKMRKLNREQVHQGLAIQKKQKAKGKRNPLGQILIELGLITEDDLKAALGAQRGMPFVDLDSLDIDEATTKQITAQSATTYRIVPVTWDEATGELTVAMADPDNFGALDDLRTLMGFQNVKSVLASEEAVTRALNRYYSVADESVSDIIDELADDVELQDISERGDSIDLEDIKQLAESNPIKRLLNVVLLQAIRDKASDIHFEPFESEYKMRYRIDGLLYEMVPPPRHIAMAISSRIKVMANLDIAERRMPQDGRIELTVNASPVDLRVSVLPTMFGESVVMRVLDRSQVSLDLDRVGMREEDLRDFRWLSGKPNGIVIVTGPTGSGKTTTLYSALQELNDVKTKIITTEDPVEYDIDGLIQCQMNTDIGLTFARCLRSILRQDPDIILVGEIRDLETAEISVQSSLTGHLVFSTLHTNDAPSAIARLLDLGLEPFLVTATLEGIVAQRLVRKICPNCKEAFEPTEEMLMELNLTPEDVHEQKFFHGRGCDYCHNTGYRGRQGIFEIMRLDDDLKEMIMQHRSSNVLRVEARKRGMRSLRDNGLAAIFDGDTTIEEVVRETIQED